MSLYSFYLQKLLLQFLSSKKNLTKIIIKRKKEVRSQKVYEYNRHDFMQKGEIPLTGPDHVICTIGIHNPSYGVHDEQKIISLFPLEGLSIGIVQRGGGDHHHKLRCQPDTVIAFRH